MEEEECVPTRKEQETIAEALQKLESVGGSYPMMAPDGMRYMTVDEVIDEIEAGTAIGRAMAAKIVGKQRPRGARTPGPLRGYLRPK